MNQVELFNPNQTSTPVPGFNFSRQTRKGEELLTYPMGESNVMEPRIPRYAHLVLIPLPHPASKKQLLNEQIYLVLAPEYVAIGRLWKTPEALFIIPENRDYPPHRFSYSEIQELKFYRVLAYYVQL